MAVGRADAYCSAGSVVSIQATGNDNSPGYFQPSWAPGLFS